MIKAIERAQVSFNNPQDSLQNTISPCSMLNHKHPQRNTLWDERATLKKKYHTVLKKGSEK